MISISELLVKNIELRHQRFNVANTVFRDHVNSFKDSILDLRIKNRHVVVDQLHVEVKVVKIDIISVAILYRWPTLSRQSLWGID